jgi:hypothetical protein
MSGLRWLLVGAPFAGGMRTLSFYALLSSILLLVAKHSDTLAL